MLLFIAKRLAAGIVLIFVVSSLTFFLIKSSGHSPVRALLGVNATPAQVHTKTIELGLDRPVVVQFFDWLGGVFRGDLGTSWVNQQPVASELANRLPVTVSLAITATLIAAILGLAMGVAAATWGPIADRVLQVLAIVGAALPSFWVALVLSSTFAINLHLFPATGYVSLFQSLPGWAQSITLPVVSLVLAAAAAVAQQARNSILEVSKMDFVRTLRSRGLSERRILWVNVVRNSSGPALTVISLQFIGLLSGAIIIEQVFALPGLGGMALSATQFSDVPAVLGIVLASVTTVVAVNLLVDIAYGALNPKVRVS